MQASRGIVPDRGNSMCKDTETGTNQLGSEDSKQPASPNHRRPGERDRGARGAGDVAGAQHAAPGHLRQAFAAVWARRVPSRGGAGGADVHQMHRTVWLCVRDGLQRGPGMAVDTVGLW